MAVAVAVLLVVVAFAISTSLVVRACRTTPTPLRADDAAYGGDRAQTPGTAAPLRLLSRLLFARRSFDAITLDCTLVQVDGLLPANLDPPQGLPFTLRLRCPDTSWFAGRVEEILTEWADDNRELVLELTPERGKVRTTIASGNSSVHLELAAASGFGADLSAA